MRRIAAWVLISTVVVVVATAATALAVTPSALHAQIVAAARAQKSVHRTATFRSSLPHRHSNLTETADVGVDAGTELDRFDLTYHQGWARLRFVDGTVYVRGNAVGLEHELGINGGKGTRYSGRWISIPKGDKLYAGLAGKLTVSSVLHVVPRGRLRLFRRTVHGRRFIILYGSSSPIGLYVHAGGSRLPVGFSGGGHVSWASGTFTKWNEPVHVTAPAHSTPIVTVRGG